MTYATTNQPIMVNNGSINDNVGMRFWQYQSADVAATVAGAAYFTDGKTLGMKVHDLVFVSDTTTPLITVHQVLSFTGQATNLSAGTTIGAAS